MNIASILVNSARSFPARPAVSLGREQIFSYSQLGCRTACLAKALQDQQGGKGRVIAIASPNCIEYMEILFAGWHAGMAVAPMNAQLNVKELAYMIEDCGATIAFVSADLVEGLSTLLPDVRYVVPGGDEYTDMLSAAPGALTPCSKNDLAWIFYTSGTTGKPKGAMLSHGNLFAMTVAYYADIDFLNETDALLHLAATSHASGLFGLSFVAKAANNILPASGGFDPDELAALINSYENLTFFIPPTVLRRIENYPVIATANLNNLKTVLLGAAPINSRDIRAGYKIFGPKLWNGYGQGESPCTITAMSKSMIATALAKGCEDQLCSVGVVRTGLEVRIVDDQGQPVPKDELGEVVVKGDTVMGGYLNRPEDTAEALKNGWLYTGDMGKLDDQGYLTLLDRKKDVIISGGMNIYAREIEDILLSSPEVLEVAVIGVPDPEWGESVMAIIVPTTGAKTDQAMLDALCLDKVARFKRPKFYGFVAELPKNTSGKVLKREMREQYATRAKDKL